MDQIELACPFCAGRFQAEAATESRATICPQCGRLVTVPAATTPTSTSPPLDLAASGTDAQRWSATRSSEPRPFNLVAPTKTVVNRRGEAVPLHRLSPEERIRYRRRLNLAFAAIGMVLLAIVLFVLVRLRP